MIYCKLFSLLNASNHWSCVGILKILLHISTALTGPADKLIVAILVTNLLIPTNSINSFTVVSLEILNTIPPFGLNLLKYRTWYNIMKIILHSIFHSYMSAIRLNQIRISLDHILSLHFYLVGILPFRFKDIMSTIWRYSTRFILRCLSIVVERSSIRGFAADCLIINNISS